MGVPPPLPPAMPSDMHAGMQVQAWLLQGCAAGLWL